MMIYMIVLIFLMLFDSFNLYVGIGLFLIMFMYLMWGFNILWMDLFKGDLFMIIGVDLISYLMVLILLWLVSLITILYCDWLVNKFMLILLLVLMLMFLSLDFIYMFICFEFSMLPMFLVIMFLGGLKERYLASMYMFIYTVVSSLPSLMLMMMVVDSSMSSSMDYMVYGLGELDTLFEFFVVLMFLVKVPLFLVHVWLPKAHVEAPVYGSMFLASIMLKMGGYGLVRCMMFMFMDSDWVDYVFCVGLVSLMVLGYSCIFQVDLKVLVAYSSIIHMGLMVVGLFSSTELGYIGGLIMMLSHGVCSSGMFYLVNCIYELSGSRLVVVNKGMMGVMPLLLFFWLVMLINNLGVPPCFGILGELMLMSGCMEYSFGFFFCFFFIVFFLSCFVINMYSLMVGGDYVFKNFDMKMITYYGSIMHLIPLNFFIFF